MRRVWLSLPFAAQRASPPRNRFSWTYVENRLMCRRLLIPVVLRALEGARSTLIDVRIAITSPVEHVDR